MILSTNMLCFFLTIISSSFLLLSFNFVEAGIFDPILEIFNYTPLYITDHLSDAYMPIENIQQKAEVHLGGPLDGTQPSYSGFFTVDRSCNSNLFFWFFKSPTASTSKPLVLWLQGGPGNTFLQTLFDGNGPYRLRDGVLVPSNESWTEDFNMLYIDNPVGAGFSFTDDNEACYSKTIQHAVDNTYTALFQFYSLFPEYRNNEFYLTGESYAGKYISVLASLISEKNQPQASGLINLQGLFIGCGFIDPQNQLYYADPLYEMGLISGVVREQVRDLEGKMRTKIKEKEHGRAAYYLSSITLLVNSPIDLLNQTMGDKEYTQMKKYIENSQTRSAIHVGMLEFRHSRTQVLWHFRNDFFKSASSYLSKAVRQYKVLLYSGQQDTFIPPKQIDHVISSLQGWDDLPDFQRTEYQSWYVGSELAGYKKSFKKFTQVEVRQSDHYIVKSQPKWMRELFRSFVKNEL